MKQIKQEQDVKGQGENRIGSPLVYEWEKPVCMHHLIFPLNLCSIFMC